MHDQADQLRALVRAATQADAGLAAPPPRKIVVCGGKGGVGATTIAVNLSIALARLGARVVLVDADVRQADVAALCALEARDTIADVLSARRTVHEVLHRGPAGIQILAGMWSGAGVPDCSPAAQERLLAELNRLGRHADLVVMDVGCGLDHVIRRFWQAADCVLLVATPERVAIMDAYASIKVLAVDPAEASPRPKPNTVGPLVQMIVNRADAETARAVHSRIDGACERFLNRRIALAGHVCEDHRIGLAAASGRPFALESGELGAARDLERIAEQILNDRATHKELPSQPGSRQEIVAA